MNNYERIKQIMNILYQRQSISVDELEQLLKVSPATIRRDLKKLCEKGLVVRYPGGVALPEIGFGHEPSLEERESENLAAKRAIGLAAAKLVNEREVVGIDIGTTTLELARALKDRQDITVFTFSIPIAYTLIRTKMNVYLTGGYINHKELCLGGPIAREVIRQYHYDKFFLAAAGVSEEHGITDFDIDAIETKRYFIENSKEVILLVDSSKFGKVSFKTICGITGIDKIITDENADPDMIKDIKRKGVEVIIAPIDKV